MYCDCILASSGFQSGYIAVFIISAIFVGAAVAVMAGGWRRTDFEEIESVKRRMLREE